jgi:hypothetical protein
MPTDRYAGNQGWVSLNGVVYETAEWEGEVTVGEAVGRAGGDTWTHRTPTHKDWSASYQAYFPRTSPPNPVALVGTVVPFVGHIIQGGTGFFAASGLVMSAKINVKCSNDQLVAIDVQVKCSDGSTGPVITTGSP